MRGWLGRARGWLARSWRDDPADLALRVATTVLLAGIAVHYLAATEAIGSDQALYLNIGRLFREGKLPYVDVVEVNPPLIGYLSVIPVVLADALGVSVIPVFNLVVLGPVVVATGSILRLAGRGTDRLTASAIGLAWAVANAWVVQQQAWGQRDHLFVALALPLILLRMDDTPPAAVGRGRRIVIGIAAALGALLKPGFVVLLLALEMGRVVRGRSTLRRADYAAFAAVTAVYAALLLAIPSVRREGFGRWIPLVARQYVPAYTAGIDGMARPPVWLTVAFAVVAIAGALQWSRQRRRSTPSQEARRSDPTRLFVLLAIGCAVYFTFQTAWAYQLVPFELFALLSIGSAVAGWWIRSPLTLDSRTAIVRAAAVVVVAASLLGAVAVVRRSPSVGGTDQILDQAIEDLSSAGDRILLVTTSAGEADKTFLVADRRHGSRFPWTFPIALYAWARPADRLYPTPERDENEFAFVRDLQHDITHLRPKLVLVMGHGPCEGCPPGFDVRVWMERSGLEQWLAKRYTRAPDRGAWAVYVRPGHA